MEKGKMLIDFTGNEDESHRRYVVSALGDNRVTAASKVNPTKTDETDNKFFEESYKYNDAIKYLRSISNK